MQADNRIGSSPRDQVKPATVSTDATEQDTLFGISQGSLERGTCRAWSSAATDNKGFDECCLMVIMTLCSEQTPHQQLRSLLVCILCRLGSVCSVFWVSRSRCARLLYQSLLLENSCARVDGSGGTGSCGSGYGVRCCLLKLFLATMLRERGLVICGTRFVSLRARCTPVACRDRQV